MGVMNLIQGQKAAASNLVRTQRLSSSSNTMYPPPRTTVWDTFSQTSPTGSHLLRRAGWDEEAASTQAEDKATIQRGVSFLDRQIVQLQEFHDKQIENDQESKKFGRLDTVMGSAIVLNVLWIALEIDWGPEHGEPPEKRIFWMFGNSCFLIAFIVEVAIRMYVERGTWIYGGWNWFDSIVVLCGTIDVWILTFIEGSIGNIHALSVLRIARLVRLVRMIKLVRNLNSLYVILMAFFSAIRSMVFLVIIMFFGMLIYAIFTTLLIGQNSTFDDVRINGDTVEDRFGKVYRSMYSLFELMTLEGWEQVARPLVEKQPAVFLIIGSFIMIFTYGLLNMVVATVVEKTLQQSEIMKHLNEKADMLKTLRELEVIKELFTSGLGEEDAPRTAITRRSLEEALSGQPKIRQAFEGMGVPLRSATELFDVLDCESEDAITVKELIDGIAKIQGGGISTWDTMYTYAAVKVLKSDMHELRKEVFALAQRNAEVDARLDRQDSLLQSQHAMLKELLDRTRDPSCRSTSELGDVSAEVLPSDFQRDISCPFELQRVTSLQ